jgi:hypothetical protein
MPSEMVSPELCHFVLDHGLGKHHILIEDTQELGLLSHGEVVEVKDHRPIHAPEIILVRHSVGDASKAKGEPPPTIAQGLRLPNYGCTNM